MSAFSALLPIMAVFVIGCSNPDNNETVTPTPTDPIVMTVQQPKPEPEPIVEPTPEPIVVPEPEPILVEPEPVPEPDPIVVEPEPVPVEEPIIEDPVVPAPIEEPIVVIPEFDSYFYATIVYEDGSPYTDGLIQIEGDGWVSYAPTNAEGFATAPVFGDQRFKLSARSPWSEVEVYIYYINPLIVPIEDTSPGVVCLDGKTIAECIDDPANYLEP